MIKARNYGDDALTIVMSQIVAGWSSTGLGQMLYDKLIQVAKNKGYSFLFSDCTLSQDARKAWKKLATRYPIKKVKDGGMNIFRIDLQGK
jgi:predicted alpha/beta hydrolase